MATSPHVDPSVPPAPVDRAVAPPAAPPRSPSTRVLDKPKRRFFSADDKLRIVQAFQACRSPDERGALVRREGLYHGQITDWVAALQRGGMEALHPQRTGRKPAPATVPSSQLVDLERELARWKARAERAEALCEVQKKLSALLGLLLPPTTEKP